MTRSQSWATVPTDDERYRPLYARVLGLRFVNPGGVLCFLFFEGAVALAVLLALAELVSWWAVLVLPAVVAAMVKLNDVVAELVIRTAAQVPEQERDRFRQQMEPVVGRARVPSAVRALPGGASAPVTASWPAGPGDRAAGPGHSVTGFSDRAIGSGAPDRRTAGPGSPMLRATTLGDPASDPRRTNWTDPDPSR
ncbi:MULTISPECIES: hypothetical protein [Micromonospora]|uniref:hypothetical protein n=1 Tax=Micromonospora TaxID=1873 RepID=UPI001F3EF95E|nr:MULTISPECIES: hypothetical protein [Micromonospora]